MAGTLDIWLRDTPFPYYDRSGKEVKIFTKDILLIISRCNDIRSKTGFIYVVRVIKNDETVDLNKFKSESELIKHLDCLLEKESFIFDDCD